MAFFVLGEGGWDEKMAGVGDIAPCGAGLSPGGRPLRSGGLHARRGERET